MLERYSEPYMATGGLAAEGVINQLGRPDIEPLEVLVREAVQNCWDAKRADVGSIRVHIGRQVLTGPAAEYLRSHVFTSPPAGLPLRDHLRDGVQTLYFADFGTDGLGGPTRADQPGAKRDFVDFVRNIGQPPDKDLGGGSFGYGKAAFYIASRARTILVDTLCLDANGQLERRLIGCALGDNYDDERGRPFTGRHWWGRLVEGVPEPVTGAAAAEIAAALGLPQRSTRADLGSTVMIVAPGVAPESEGGTDGTIGFIADALAWNFWPRLIDTPGATRRTMEFRLSDDGTQVRVPNPRTHQRLQGFVEAMDRLREEPGDDDDFLLDRSIECLRPVQRLGRLIIHKGPVTPADLPERSVPQGARITADSVHHVALMRNAELVVKYLPGPAPLSGRVGYSGVFRCATTVDEAFRKAEPPTHDDWVHRSVPKDGHQQRFVKIALERIADACREAAGYDATMRAAADGAGIPLGEFADALAGLMPGSDGPGARRSRSDGTRPSRRRRRAPGRARATETAESVWVDGSAETTPPEDGARAASTAPESASGATTRPPRAPQTRTVGDPSPAISADGLAVVRYPFELRSHGNRVRLSAAIEVMANDGGQVESDAPLGAATPIVRAWISPHGRVLSGTEVTIGPEEVDGAWIVEVDLSDEMMMRVDLTAAIA